jgi:hypothetical protein
MQYWDSHYPCRWTGPVVWPPQSCSPTPADLLWGHLKSIVYSQQYNTWDELWNATETAGMAVRSIPDVIQKTKNSLCIRAQLCIYCNDEPFQHIVMTIGRVWIGNWIYWTLTDHNYNYSALTSSHTLQFTTARTKSFQSSLSSPVDVPLLPGSHPCRLAAISHQPPTLLTSISRLPLII